ncbi:MAG: hypothetical protein AAF514_19015 [Verrucomicrobiota bacterium]
MIISLEATARRHAIMACLRSVLMYGLLITPWFVGARGPMGGSWALVFAISILLAAIALLCLPLERIAGAIVKHLHPTPPPTQFENVVTEIAIALQEPVERIQTSECPVANIAMLPAPEGETVVATTGALERLTRNELQALVAAQFAGMRDRWCRLATRAEILWWGLLWILPLFLIGMVLGKPLAGILTFMIFVLHFFLPRWNEQARDLCADVAAVRTTLDPQALGSAMRKLAEQASRASRIKLGAWYLPNNPFMVIPKRVQSTTTVSGGGSSRRWTSTDEVRLELLLRADRAEALASGSDPGKYTGREFRRRWGQLGKT